MEANNELLQRYLGGSKLLGIDVQKKERVGDLVQRYHKVLREVERTLVYRPLD